MSTEEHIFENALFDYHRAVVNNRNPIEEMKHDNLLITQCIDYRIDLATLFSFVGYVYYNVLNSNIREIWKEIQDTNPSGFEKTDMIWAFFGDNDRYISK